MRKSLKYIIVSFLYLIIFSSELLAETSPSFDCAKATTEVEKLICSDDELAKLDVEMNKSYHAFMKTLDEEYYRNKLKKKQREWLNYREKLTCFNTDDTKITNCLKDAYQHRIENLNAWITRKNYDFFIDYPDYYEQKDWVGYRKPIGKFISKLGDEYYINCTTHTIFPKFPEEKVYFADVGAKFPGNVEIIYQTEDFIYFQCANVSDMLADQSLGEFFPGLLNAPLNKLASYPTYDYSSINIDNFQQIIKSLKVASGLKQDRKEKCENLQKKIIEYPIEFIQPIVANSFEELKDKAKLNCSYKQFSKINPRKTGKLLPPFVFYQLPKFGNFILSKNTANSNSTCLFSPKECECIFLKNGPTVEGLVLSIKNEYFFVNAWKLSKQKSINIIPITKETIKKMIKGGNDYKNQSGCLFANQKR